MFFNELSTRIRRFRVYANPADVVRKSDTSMLTMSSIRPHRHYSFPFPSGVWVLEVLQSNY